MPSCPCVPSGNLPQSEPSRSCGGLARRSVRHFVGSLPRRGRPIATSRPGKLPARAAAAAHIRLPAQRGPQVNERPRGGAGITTLRPSARRHPAPRRAPCRCWRRTGRGSLPAVGGYAGAAAWGYADSSEPAVGVTSERFLIADVDCVWSGQSRSGGFRNSTGGEAFTPYLPAMTDSGAVDMYFQRIKTPGLLTTPI